MNLVSVLLEFSLIKTLSFFFLYQRYFLQFEYDFE